MNFDFSSIKVLLIGDFMIDHYIMGTSNRLSPEAPAPVVIPDKEYSIPGGSGNVAMNLSNMGAQVTCAGSVGNDDWGKQLFSIFKKKGIGTDYIYIPDNHPTTLKQRIYSNGEQVVRIDKETYFDLYSHNQNQTKEIDYKEYDVIIISDYNKGTINNIKSINADMVIVDPKKDNFSLYKNAHIITPNLNELQRATQIEIKNDQSIVYACNELIENNNLNYIVAKKGNKGLTIVGRDNFFKHIEAQFVENPDVTGAGDTVVAVLSIVYAQTQDIELAAQLANAAAAIAVSNPGTYAVSINDLYNIKYL